VPDALVPVLARLRSAMAEEDFAAIFNAADALTALSDAGLAGGLKDEAENLAEAAKLMNYAHAGAIIDRLLTRA